MKKLNNKSIKRTKRALSLVLGSLSILSVCSLVNDFNIHAGKKNYDDSFFGDKGYIGEEYIENEEIVWAYLDILGGNYLEWVGMQCGCIFMKEVYVRYNNGNIVLLDLNNSTFRVINKVSGTTIDDELYIGKEISWPNGVMRSPSEPGPYHKFTKVKSKS